MVSGCVVVPAPLLSNLSISSDGEMGRSGLRFRVAPSTRGTRLLFVSLSSLLFVSGASLFTTPYVEVDRLYRTLAVEYEESRSGQQ